MNELRRSYRFILYVDDIDAHCVLSAKFNKNSITVEYYDPVFDPVSTKIFKVASKGDKVDVKLMITDGDGNVDQVWSASGMDLKEYSFDNLDYRSVEPLIITAVFSKETEGRESVFSLEESTSKIEEYVDDAFDEESGNEQLQIVTRELRIVEDDA